MNNVTEMKKKIEKTKNVDKNSLIFLSNYQKIWYQTRKGCTFTHPFYHFFEDNATQLSPSQNLLFFLQPSMLNLHPFLHHLITISPKSFSFHDDVN
jgi:hypothetical protein